MTAEARIAAAARSIEALAPALAGLEACPAEREAAERASARGHFTPAEDECVHAWFARYLTARAGLLETIDDLTPIARSETPGTLSIDDHHHLQAFILVYTAACLLVRAARYLLEEFATNTLVQRKLNEAEKRYRIPRKQYTEIYKSLTNPVNAWRLREAVHLADGQRADIDAMRSDPRMAGVLSYLDESEDAVRVGLRDVLSSRLKYRWHSLRRRRASAAQKSVFGFAEAFGKLIGDLRNPWHASQVQGELRARLAELLQPGDVIATRHHHKASNLFLPGYWPHVALHVGSAEACTAHGVSLDEERATRWVEPNRVLEARKDGVRLRPLDETLTVDAVAIIRPKLSGREIAEALARVLEHEGKLYNFDFDFFRADKLVCTEVVYRAYDGVASMSIDLRERAGRPTLAAEDLLDMAIDGRGFEPIAVFGAENCPEKLVTGAEVHRVLAESYRPAAPSQP